MKYPRVLIVGQLLNEKSGGGITLSNLFKNWPKDKLAVATNIYLKNELDFSVCEIYYQLGYNNKQHPFPLNIFHPRIKCGIIEKNNDKILDKKNNNDQAQSKINHPKRKSIKFYKIHTFLNSALMFLGIYNFIYKLQINEDFRKWLIDYNPDIIYTQLSNLELIRFVNKIQLETKKPLAIHIMDDWPAKITQPGLFQSYWKSRINKEFRNLLNKSTVLMSICEAMSKEYKKRYNKDFIPFHNPVEVGQWLPYTRNQWENKKIFNILYTGRIGTANGKSIMTMAKTIDSINSKEFIMKLDIFTPDVKSKNGILINNLKGVELKNTRPHSSMPHLLSGYDLLFLPLDFDEEGIIFSQFSMPTKVSEYMISGTPILVFADRRTALANYALNDKWAYTISENKIEILSKGLHELYSNSDLRKEIASKAIKIAIQNENAEMVREEFRKALLKNLETTHQ